MNHPQIEIKIKGKETVIKAELYPEYAPKTVENFLKLVESDFYSGLIFHRVICDFMIQGGGLDEYFTEKDTAPIYGEFRANGFPQNTLKHERGVLSMARTNQPNSASSQFFIMHANAPYLDGQYAAFGKVTEGFELVDEIANMETVTRGWYDDVPAENVVIEKMTVISK